MFGNELWASAPGRLRAAAPFGRNSEFKIQDSKAAAYSPKSMLWSATRSE